MGWVLHLILGAFEGALLCWGENGSSENGGGHLMANMVG